MSDEARNAVNESTDTAARLSPNDAARSSPNDAAGGSPNDAAREAEKHEERPVLHHLQTVRTGRYYTAGAPAASTRRVWFVLHGYAQLAERFLRHFQRVIPSDTMVVAPEGLSRFYLELPRADGGHLSRVGAAWLTREDREVEIADSRGWLDSVYREVTDEITRATGVMPSVTVLAFSQGVATAMRWIASGVVSPSRVVFWGGGLAADIDQNAIRSRMANVELLFVAGTRDVFATPEARQRIMAECKKLGLNAREISYDGVHELDRTTVAELLNLP